MRYLLDLQQIHPDLADRLVKITDVYWVEGDVKLLDLPLAAVIGTRSPSDEGIRRTRRLAKLLVDAGFVVVSGLAAGVDAEAHKTAIACGGKTIAVLGTPLERCYPVENAFLQKEIARKGLILSRFPPGSKTTRSSFPMRNVVMGAMSLISIVVEATEASGTRHQVEAAIKHGRRVAFLASLVDRGISWINDAINSGRGIVISDFADLASILSTIKAENRGLVAENSSAQKVFISHALPEDNLFALWLASKLTVLGYSVWCELKELSGGEDFWRDIESTIRERTAKFLYVVSKHSNHSPGTLSELHLAQTVGRDKKDFVIPILIDSTDPLEVNIQLLRLNCIKFSDGWGKGLAKVVEKLRKDNVPTSGNSGPRAGSKLWKQMFGEFRGLQAEPETLISNQFPLLTLPSIVYVSKMRRKREIASSRRLTPGQIIFNERIFSLRPLDHAEMYSMECFLDDGYSSIGISSAKAKDIVRLLIRAEVESGVLAGGFREYALSNRRKAFWFPSFGKSHPEIKFTYPDGTKGRRALCGYETLKDDSANVSGMRNWHFAIQFNVTEKPQWSIVAKAHVVYSENGELYESPKKQHSLRRRGTKLWYNCEWSDRLMTMMQFIAGPDQSCWTVPIQGDTELSVSVSPLIFKSDFTYDGATGAVNDDEPDFDDIDDEDNQT